MRLCLALCLTQEKHLIVASFLDVPFFNKKLLGTSATLVVTGALLVVTVFAIKNNKLLEFV